MAGRRIVAVWGSSPGAGKSTVAAAIVAGLRARGHDVDLFQEEEILERPAFASVAAEFRATGVVEPPVLLDASRTFAGELVATPPGWTVTDTLFPFTASLVAWGHDEASITDFVAELHGILARFDPVVVYLDADPTAALRRADAREAGWLDQFVAKVGGFRLNPPPSDLDAVVGYLRSVEDVTLRVLAATGWRVARIDGDRPTDDIVADVLVAIGTP